MVRSINSTHYYLRRGGYVTAGVFLSVCEQNKSIASEIVMNNWMILMNFSVTFINSLRNKWWHFGDLPDTGGSLIFANANICHICPPYMWHICYSQGHVLYVAIWIHTVCVWQIQKSAFTVCHNVSYLTIHWILKKICGVGFSLSVDVKSYS